MIFVQRRGADGAVTSASDALAEFGAPGVVWIDLENPTEAEELAVERTLGIDVLTPAERAAFEESARFYREGDAIYITATLLGSRSEGHFVHDAVTFILLPDKLVTVRTIRPRAFVVGPGRASVRIGAAASGAEVFDALLDSVIERIADILQEGSSEATQQSALIFGGRGGDLASELRVLGRWGSMVAIAFQSLASLQRVVVYLESMDGECGLKRERLVGLRRDIEQLERTAEALQDHITFLQAAALGLVSAAQNNVLKALSVATMAFVPPTLIASIFGMNFEGLTWFKEPWGPHAAFAMMVAAPACLFLLAKWRRWF